MLFFSPRWVLVSLAIGWMLNSCAESKVSQCNRLIREINRGQGVYRQSAEQMTMVGGFNPRDQQNLREQITKVKQSLEKFVVDLRQASRDVRVVLVVDPQLQALRDRYSDNLSSFAQGLEEASKAMETLANINFVDTNALRLVQDTNQKLSNYFQQVGTAGAETNRVITEINTYCGVR